MSSARALEWILVGLLLVTLCGYTPFARGSPADGLALVLLWVAATRPELRHRVGTTPRLLALLAIAVLLSVATLVSPAPTDAVLAAAKILLWLGVGTVVFAIAADAAMGQRLIRIAVLAAGVMAGIGACLGLAGAVFGELPGTQLYPNFPLGFAAVRFVGFFPTANDVALVLLLALLGVPLAGLERRRDRLVITLVLLAGMVATWSRLLVPALLALAITHRFRGRLLALVAAGCALVGASWVTHVHMARDPHSESLWVASPTPFAQVGDLYLSTMGYLDLKLAAVDMWLSHPLFGVGLRGFGPSLGHHVEPAQLTKLLEIGATPHSTYGMILSELGLVGAVIIGVFVNGVWRCLAPRNQTAPRFLVAAAAALLWVAIDLELQHHRVLYIAIGLVGAAVPVDPAPGSNR